jgi:hypothetical protein
VRQVRQPPSDCANGQGAAGAGAGGPGVEVEGEGGKAGGGDGEQGRDLLCSAAVAAVCYEGGEVEQQRGEQRAWRNRDALQVEVLELEILQCLRSSCILCERLCLCVMQNVCAVHDVMSSAGCAYPACHPFA